MSQDIQVSHICPHYIRYEQYSLKNETDIITRSPIKGLGLFDLRKDGVSIPPSGLMSSAEIIFPLNNPYRIVNPNYVFIYKGLPYNLKLPLGILNQTAILNSLNAQLPSQVQASVFNQTILIKDNENIGLSSQLEIKGDLTKLGFKYDSFKAQGKVLHSGWSLVKRNDFLGLMVKLNSPSKGIYEIDYTTEKSYCNRCASTGVENDFRYNEFGELSLLANENLLYQQVAKICLTRLNSNPYFAWYGSRAFDLIGQKQNENTKQLLSESVRDALSKFVNVQNQVATVQNLTLEERVLSIRSVNVDQISNLSYLVTVSIVNRSNKEINVSIVFAVPGSYELEKITT